MSVLRRLAAILSDGSLVLWHKRFQPLLDWAREGGIVQRIVRSAMLAFPAWIIIRTVRAHPKLMWPLAIAWCWAAWRAQRGAPSQPGAPAAVEVEREGADGSLLEVSPAEFLRIVRAAIGDARGVHLVSLVERLAEAHPDRRWDIPSVRDLAASAGVPVRPVVRAPGRGPTVGIHRDDLPCSPASASAAPVPVVEATTSQVNAATTGTTTPTATAPTTAAEEVAEQGFVVEDDPANDRRALVKWS